MDEARIFNKTDIWSRCGCDNHCWFLSFSLLLFCNHYTLKRKCHFDEIFITGCTGNICEILLYRRLLVVITYELIHVVRAVHRLGENHCEHYDDVIMSAIASQITSLTIVYSIVYSDADQRNHQSSASLVFVWGIHRGPVNSPHKWPVTRKMFPFDDVIMNRTIISHPKGG